VRTGLIFVKREISILLKSLRDLEGFFVEQGFGWKATKGVRKLNINTFYMNFNP
jgi:hypothetical protein